MEKKKSGEGSRERSEREREGGVRERDEKSMRERWMGGPSGREKEEDC